MQNNPEIIDGIKCFAPLVAHENTGFDKASFKRLFDLEEKNFWFRSRNKVIKTLIKNYFGENKDGHFLEIGCGTGYVLNGLKEFERLTLSGAEIFLEGLKYSKMRLPEAEFIQLDATNIPFENEFECIGAFDVLEHIEEDERVMKNVFNALKENGCFFISVPQYMSMWSYLDDIACHKRRYSKKELTEKLKRAGFAVLYISSFVFTLFPFMYLIRLLKRKNNINPADDSLAFEELKINPFLNSVFRLAMRLDEILIRYRIRLPFGGSLVAVAVKY